MLIVESIGEIDRFWTGKAESFQCTRKDVSVCLFPVWIRI